MSNTVEGRFLRLPRIIDNLNAMIEATDHRLRVIHQHQEWWLRGFSEGVGGAVLHLRHTADENNEVTIAVTSPMFLANIVVQVLSQVQITGEGHLRLDQDDAEAGSRREQEGRES